MRLRQSHFRDQRTEVPGPRHGAAVGGKADARAHGGRVRRDQQRAPAELAVPDGQHPNYGKPLTTRYVGGVATPIENPYGPEGQDTALSPPLKWNLRGRYDWPVGNYIWFVQGGLQHQAQSISSTTYFTQFRMPSWTTVDASAGVSEGNWTVSLNGSNLTNVDKSLFTTDTEIILTETPMRPRVISLNFGYSWTQHQ